MLESPTAIDDAKLPQSSDLHEILETLLQSCSIMLEDDDSIKEIAMCMKKIEEKVREQSGENFRSGNYEVLICFSVMLCLLYDALIMFVNHN